jgi:hypothetical protein
MKPAAAVTFCRVSALSSSSTMRPGPIPAPSRIPAMTEASDGPKRPTPPVQKIGLSGAARAAATP